MRKIEAFGDKTPIRIGESELIEVLFPWFRFGIVLKTFRDGSCELWKSKGSLDEKCSCGKSFSSAPLIFSEKKSNEHYFIQNLTNGVIFVEISENKEAPIKISREDILEIRGQIVEGSFSNVFLKGNEYALKRFFLESGEKASEGLVFNSSKFRIDIICFQGKGRIFLDRCFEIERSIADFGEGAVFDLRSFYRDREYFIRNVYVKGAPLDFIVLKSKKLK